MVMAVGDYCRKGAVGPPSLGSVGCEHQLRGLDIGLPSGGSHFGGGWCCHRWSAVIVLAQI